MAAREWEASSDVFLKRGGGGGGGVPPQTFDSASF